MKITINQKLIKRFVPINNLDTIIIPNNNTENIHTERANFFVGEFLGPQNNRKKQFDKQYIKIMSEAKRVARVESPWTLSIINARTIVKMYGQSFITVFSILSLSKLFMLIPLCL